MKNLKTLGKVLSRDEQKEVNGGKTVPVICNGGYFNNETSCKIGYHPHPLQGHCICCAD
ncbi:hypothetical protein [Psychroserpens sp. NJDZ02]|uniref:hypothetical protein n=1 Tax=Psychroserpens sp. NJDZ02 TaxID=2570561 RepID=UPI0014562CD1|nr:hypothetical protein [Psychroserpens sp. NJDZ02]